MHYFDLLLGWVPLWGWIVMCVVFAAPLFYFFGPIIIAFWNMLPRTVQVVLGGIGAVLLAFAAGRYKGASTERDEQRRREAGAIKNREEVDRDVGSLSEKDTRDRLNRWNRD